MTALDDALWVMKKQKMEMLLFFCHPKISNVETQKEFSGHDIERQLFLQGFNIYSLLYSIKGLTYKELN